MKILSQYATVLAVAVIVLMGAVGVLGYKYVKTQKALQTISTDPSTVQKAAAAQVKSLVAEVGKLIQLPNETPTVATITDVNKLKDQPFFANAKNGDKVLIYTGAKKAILFREAENKIIDVAPVIIGTSSATQSQARIALENGSGVVGATSKVETQINSAFPGVQIVSKTDAKGSYDNTIVVALNDAAKDAAVNLAKAIGATAGGLPSTETKPSSADILVLIGKDLANK